ncbi:hypothetical protein A2954_06540 [Candidatus Roizmanbacteria bacterium RIFCSPLOWO2_01_FULL_37_12]|uniref:Uncharacterized protein n=1 Tax=Candidatus Roizmanbacteria bacterium RIFCSPLOWO2_01_FULL_37_12 TaxID=1802056 RepID=A0A1F7I9X1_9BACT|nr:MAG: hypothetical protein A2768_00745 [Candidatus Roizmanbacteria bacterium RIFCSPHIGHO2_01_FULL_37_16]OGK26842.1 MAG: hypothetical protein A3D76_05160 [Candidatus Roizmanbacteria bacterium RIFCSPHIGHO2_02_FULL_37_9b]OGK40165.1 MAG: hypothetical protein A2954_06540 [Candidatus Roizmanbacteria bacterium RIFCSPLOWO2_01_FULL_37_12]
MSERRIKKQISAETVEAANNSTAIHLILAVAQKLKSKNFLSTRSKILGAGTETFTPPDNDFDDSNPDP